MIKRFLIFLVSIINLLSYELVLAEVRLPAILSSNMVLQRDATVKLWGWADPGEKMKIQTSWLKGAIKVQADTNRYWCCDVKTTHSKDPQSLRIKSKTSDIQLENILFGEVWLCSGQSNMWQPVKGYIGQPTFYSALSIAKSSNTELRLFTVDQKGSKTPLKDVEKFKTWQQATPERVLNFSAIGYFFGQQLQEILDCPVGLIHTSWGGSSVQAWMSNEVLKNYQEINIDEVDMTKGTQRIPTVLFNAMINPIIPYSIKGVLWYQGEANRKEPEKYKKLFPAMVEDWRTRWGIGDFPIYYAQIAPYLYREGNDVFQSVDNSAFIREAQLQCLDFIPNSGIAITMDIGDENCIHPPKKKEVVERLLLNALNQTYGYKAIDYASPAFDSLEVMDGGILLTFKNAERGLYAYDELHGFEIAGDDRVFYPALAKIVERKKVFVISDSVAQPAAVRYGWRNWVEGSLFDTNFLPASSFRTDQWNHATQAEK